MDIFIRICNAIGKVVIFQVIALQVITSGDRHKIDRTFRGWFGNVRSAVVYLQHLLRTRMSSSNSL